MEYISTHEAAEKWGISVRAVQRLLANSRIPGAKRWGRSWAIPVNASKPEDPRQSKSGENQRVYAPVPFLTCQVSLPKGEVDRAAESLKTEAERVQFRAELAEARGDFETTMQLCENVPAGSPMEICAATFLMVGAIDTGDYPMFVKANDRLKNIQGEADRKTVMLSQMTVRQSMIIREDPAEISAENFSELPAEIRPLLVYLHLKDLQANLEYRRMVDAAEASLVLMLRKDSYLLLEIYILLLGAVGYLGLNETDEAMRYISRAMEYALPDGIIMPFVEFLAVSGGLIERCLDNEYPEMKDVILDKWTQVWDNWILFRNLYTKENKTAVLSLREYQIALFIANGGTYEETAAHFGLSLGRIRNLTSTIYGKMNVNSRGELRERLLNTSE